MAKQFILYKMLEEIQLIHSKSAIAWSDVATPTEYFQQIYIMKKKHQWNLQLKKYS